ncbi:hypothetical protein Pan216_05880 [Planctomycetes bacterium Pan216]|uniref:Uncharacterized protein n=1 Tax=Kolteria novifilia TaxID=2527975 RepID=A0A518AYF3_9BACT|nr:hypothetical protein Pan216_05880 [Planctomycetes bacterium Pan216]
MSGIAIILVGAAIIIGAVAILLGNKPPSTTRASSPKGAPAPKPTSTAARASRTVGKPEPAASSVGDVPQPSAKGAVREALDSAQQRLGPASPETRAKARKAAMKQQVNDQVQLDPAVAATMLRRWMDEKKG